jgi:hypothetical protein
MASSRVWSCRSRAICRSRPLGSLMSIERARSSARTSRLSIKDSLDEGSGPFSSVGMAGKSVGRRLSGFRASPEKTGRTPDSGSPAPLTSNWAGRGGLGSLCGSGSSIVERCVTALGDCNLGAAQRAAWIRRETGQILLTSWAAMCRKPVDFSTYLVTGLTVGVAT